MVSSGGAFVVSSGGTVRGLTISGGTVDVVSGGIVSGTMTFVNSGQLTFFTGLVAGFSSTTTKMDLPPCG